jgi:CheY-like chemotaxis protein
MSKPKMILVVDDDPNLVMFFKEFFKQEGYNSFVTDDPEKAVRMSATVHPDLLIIDIKMPKIDGFGVLAKVREKTPEIKTMVVSAYVGGFESQIKKANVQGVLEKPVKFDQFEQMILDVLKVKKEELTEKQPIGSLPDFRVLLVDDETDLTDFLSECLNERGVQIDVASSGEEGVRKASETRYDVLIADHHLMGISGYEMTKKIVAESPHKPHVMAVTSTSLDGKVKSDYAKLGVSHFLDKPLRLEHLIHWLEEQIPAVQKKRKA